MSYDLPPSTRLTDYEVTDVLSSIFGLRCREPREGLAFFASKYAVYEAEPTISTVDGLSDFTATFSKHVRLTRFVNTKEASGYGMLSQVALFFCGFLCEKVPGVDFKIDPHFYVCGGKQDSSAEALIMLTATRSETVLVVWDYKPQVPNSLGDVRKRHLSETILRSFYLQKQHAYPVLHCLTDLEDFHYFSLKCAGQGRELLKYFFFKSDVAQEKDVLHQGNVL